MTRALSSDLRRRAVVAVSSGMNQRAVAKRFDVSSSCVIRCTAGWRVPAVGSDLPERFGSDTVKRRYCRWIERGVPDGFLHALTADMTATEWNVASWSSVAVMNMSAGNGCFRLSLADNRHSASPPWRPSKKT